MICAYDKMYLPQVQTAMGVMFDVGINELKISLDKLYGLFLNSSIANRISSGDTSVIAGMSGMEMLLEILEKTNIDVDIAINKSKEYWTGWAICYYQWQNGASFLKIDKEVKISEIYDLYNPYHEMDILKLVEKINKMRVNSRTDSYLKIYRKRLGITQEELSQLTNIPKKTIQQYEQRQKNINKAQVEYVIRLARALECKPEELLELDIELE